MKWLTLLLLLAVFIPFSFAQDGTGDDSQALAEALVPSRDRVALAQRLLGVGEIPPIPTTPQEVYAVGDSETFFVQNDDESFAINAELVYLNDVVYVWVQEGYSLDLNAVQESADRFANEIYGAVRGVFGSESSPGIDGDPRLHILHSADLGDNVAAYYYSESQYPNEAVSSSNEREMFFVSLDNMGYYVGTDYYDSVLAHEFQHMIHWSVDANEESWLNEGLSELAGYIAGFGISGFTSQYLNSPETQLTYWPSDGRTIIYGGGFLFTAYLLDRFGPEFMQALVAHPSNGMKSVDETFADLNIIDPVSGEVMTAELVFMDFAIANRLLDTTVADGQYGYTTTNIGGRANLTQNYDFPTEFELSDTNVEQWATQYHRISGLTAGQPLTMSFEGNSTIGLLPANAHSGQYAYWSNRVDDSDTRLTRAFDLTGVDSATLSFWMWHDIEENWDYAYVMISTDGGATWTPFETSRTTTDNPHNTSYGNAYTGQTGDWVQESIDLSAYAGQEILLRWEYITDDATIENGFLLDDVAIAELDYFEDFEQADSTWTAEGWVRIQNVIRQDFGVQIIHADNIVERLLLPEDGTTGTWEITPRGASMTIVISPFAPVTTEPASINVRFVE